jgi:hypothetical protein
MFLYSVTVAIKANARIQKKGFQGKELMLDIADFLQTDCCD